MRGFHWAAGRSLVLIEPEVFTPANALWAVSPLAFKAYAWLFHKANHSDVPDFNGTAVTRGQWLVSFTRLATELGVRDARTVKTALLELVEIDAIAIKGLQQKMPKAPAESAEGIDIKRPAKNVEASRKPQLITVCRFNERKCFSVGAFVARAIRRPHVTLGDLAREDDRGAAVSGAPCRPFSLDGLNRLYRFIR